MRGGGNMVLSIGREPITKENLESKGFNVLAIKKISKNMIWIVVQDGDKMVQYDDGTKLPKKITTTRTRQRGQVVEEYLSVEYEEIIARESRLRFGVRE